MARSKDTNFSAFDLVSGKKIFSFSRPAVMGILNISPDSFYDGGAYSTDKLVLQRAHEIVSQGADIIDLGAVSTRPGAQLPSPQEEASRLSAAVRLIRSELPHVLLSVDTCHPLPAEAAVSAGADIVNDISGGQFDPDMLSCVASLQVPYILMHTRGTPDVMQQNTSYDDILSDIARFFSAQLEQLYRLGAKDVVLDPGFGFAKTLQQNYFLLDHLRDLVALFSNPFLVGISRKSMIYRALDTAPDQALNGTTFLHAVALERGASMLRVHDVPEAVQCVRLFTQLKTHLDTSSKE